MILIPIVIISILILGSWYAYSISFFSPKKNRATVDTPLHGAQYDSVASDIHRISHIMQQYPFEEIILN